MPSAYSSDFLAGALRQRLRWSTGNLQILHRTNPLTLPGLTLLQRILFWDYIVVGWFALCNVAVMLMPLV
jgi:cellulose synthase (UDP-forming)